jgi:osmotically-inducible protein OsmY
MVHRHGSVDSDWEKVRAGDGARTADGVVGVSNLLLVKHPRATYAEGELADECERRMKWSPYLQSSHVTIDVTGTTLTLSGTVPTWRQRLEAARCARLAGAETVVNLLVIDPKPSRDDSGPDGWGPRRNNSSGFVATAP